MAYQRISFEIKDNVLWVGFGLSAQKSMTVFDEETFLELKEIVQEIENRAQELKGVIFFTHKENCFIAGADVNLIRSLSSESMASERSEMGQFLFNRIEDLKIPTLCLVNGVCLGGGLEFALSCKKILASNSSKTVFALPEVKLGILPGFGGTYRLPRKIGLPASLDMILSGSNVKAEKAKKLGLVEEVYPVEKLSEMALLHLFKNPRAKDMGISSGIKETVAEVIKENFITKKIIFQKARESVLKKTHGFYQAPLKILDLMDSCVLKGRTSYLAS